MWDEVLGTIISDFEELSSHSDPQQIELQKNAFMMLIHFPKYAS